MIQAFLQVRLLFPGEVFIQLLFILILTYL